MHIDDVKARIQRVLEDSAVLHAQLFTMHAETIFSIAQALANCFSNRRKVLLFGNGGSAADAQHMAAELVGRYRNDRTGLPAVALTTDSSILTSVANDFGYEEVFSRQIEALGFAGDIAIAISTSGRSTNILHAINKAKALGMTVFGLTGKEGMAIPIDLEITIPSSDTARIQELHITVIHLICEIVETLMTTQRKSIHNSTSTNNGF